MRERTKLSWFSTWSVKKSSYMSIASSSDCQQVKDVCVRVRERQRERERETRKKETASQMSPSPTVGASVSCCRHCSSVSEVTHNKKNMTVTHKGMHNRPRNSKFSTANWGWCVCECTSACERHGNKENLLYKVSPERTSCFWVSHHGVKRVLLTSGSTVGGQQ